MTEEKLKIANRLSCKIEHLNEFLKGLEQRQEVYLSIPNYGLRPLEFIGEEKDKIKEHLEAKKAELEKWFAEL